MQKIITILLLCVPTLAWAQLSAPGANYQMLTTALTGNEDYIFVFYDNATMSLKVEQPDSANAEFIWKKLNISARTLDLHHQESGGSFSIIPNIEEGGYQVTVRNLDNLTAPVDTFTTWVFRDTFRIDEIRVYMNDCEGLQLNIHTTPSFGASYIVYHFQQFLTPPHGGESIIRQIRSVQWTPSVDIYPNVNNPNTSWQTRNLSFAYIDAPPPLRDAAYHLEIIDVFGKSATYTTPVINAIAAKAIITIEEKINDNWQNAGRPPDGAKGEALYELRFKHDRSVNANRYEWTGFANARQSNGDRTVVWTESTSNANAEVKPQMPYNGKIYEGYTPGSYQVRLTVSNNNGCVDTDTVKYIVVEPSKFDADAIPNAFTPNGDNQNDIFTFVRGREPKSMEYINVYIYNRSGGMVYRYEGRSDAWEGWDGRMMGTGSNVAEGVYYYIISGKGWDDIEYNTKEYSGYLHLFR